MFQLIRKWKWIISVVICFLFLNLLPSSIIEKYYACGFFLWIRKLLDNTFGRLPFPSYYIFCLFLVLTALNWMLHFFREKPEPFSLRIFKAISFIAFMITLFFVLWGFNYGRVPLEDKIRLQIKPLSPQQLIAETQATVAQLGNIRSMIKKDTSPIPQIAFINNIEQNCRDAVDSALSDFKYPYSTKLRGRFVFDDMFLFFGFGGQYMPYTGEGNVDDAVFYSKKPFYLIHEMAHGNGFTQEADCNFLSYVSCVESGNHLLEYSGELNYLFYLFSELKTSDTAALKAISENLPPALKKDLAEIKAYNQKHTFKTGFIGDMINNIYLKLLGVEDGLKNYDKMILLVYAWKQK